MTSSPTTAATRALMHGIVDYAGLFPPASLSFDQTVRNFDDYRRGPDAWLLGALICPTARLAELAPREQKLFLTGPPLAISALGRSGADAAGFLAGLKTDLD